MAVFEFRTELACPPRRIYEFLLRPANALQVTPPDLKAKILEAPERLEVGSRMKVQVRRFGLAQTMVSEVLELKPDSLLQDAQVEGAFRRWVHTHALEAMPAGTRMTDRIDFEPPGGLLGLVVTESFLRRDLEKIFAYRAARFKELLDDRPA